MLITIDETKSKCLRSSKAAATDYKSVPALLSERALLNFQTTVATYVSDDEKTILCFWSN
jgi:hypothetical protein